MAPGLELITPQEAVARQGRQIDRLRQQLAALSRECEDQWAGSRQTWDELAAQGEAVQAALNELRARRSGGQGSSYNPTDTPGRAGTAQPMGFEAYREMAARIREMVGGRLPLGATVVVVSKGDNALLQLEGRTGWHYPQREDGVYAGHYPATSADAIAHLEALRLRGADYLLFPATASWWLDHYTEFRRHLEDRYQVVADDPDTCLIYGLGGQREARPDPPAVEHTPPAATVLHRQIHEVLRSLLPPDTTVVLLRAEGVTPLEFDGYRTWLLEQPPNSVGLRKDPGVLCDTVRQLEELRVVGAQYLIVPTSADQWLRTVGQDLVHLYRVVTHQQHVCRVHALQTWPASSGIEATACNS